MMECPHGYNIYCSECAKQTETTINRLRGQLQNCVNHLEYAKRRSHGQTLDKYEKAIESANKILYETLHD